jgi:putative peptidoglycan lipid II flippase
LLRLPFMVSLSCKLAVISAVLAMLSLASQILTARTFGARHQFDVYLFAISIPLLVTGAAAGALSQAFVPRLMAARHESGRLYQDSVRALLVIAMVAGPVIAFGGLSVTEWSTSAMDQVFTASDRAMVVHLARVAWLSAGLALLASALTAIHHAEKSYLLPAVTGTSLYVGMIAAMVGVSSPRTPIILVGGMLAGSLFSVVALMPRVLRCIPFHGFAKPEFHFLLSGIGRVGLVIIANCAFTGLAPVEALLAPRFGHGALSYLGYSERLIIAMGAMVVAGPNVLLVPAIAEACAAKDTERVSRLAFKTIAAVVVIATLLALIFGILRVPVISLLLQRGAFDQATTRGVADALPWMLVGSVAMLGAQTAFRALYGQNIHGFPAVVGLIVPGLYFLLALVLVRWLGFQGICIAYAVCWWLAFLALLVKIFALRQRRMREMMKAPIWGMLAALTATAGTVLVAQRLLLPPQATGNSFDTAMRCLAVAGLGLVSFAVAGALVWPHPTVRGLLLVGRRAAPGK